MSVRYQVSTVVAVSRPLLAVRARLRQADLAFQIPALLQRVYTAAKHLNVLDGQNVVVYRGGVPELDVEIGVGLTAQMDPPEGLIVTQTPAGEAAHVTHWGDYALMARAHESAIAWCMSNERSLAGPSWEVYGHWSDDPAKVRTDIYYLLIPDR